MWDKPRALNWVANLLNALAAVMFFYGLVYVVVHLPIFPLKEVRVEGKLDHVTREQIKLIAARHLQGNFFTVDVVKARDAFQKLPWARKVSVRKRWPDRLEVVIEEQKELARWGNIALVNTYGELFHAASDSDLPVFYGPGDGVAEVAKQYEVYSQILSAGTGMHIAQLALTSRRAWQIKTNTGMVIELGREEMGALAEIRRRIRTDIGRVESGNQLRRFALSQRVCRTQARGIDAKTQDRSSLSNMENWRNK